MDHAEQQFHLQKPVRFRKLKALLLRRSDRLEDAHSILAEVYNEGHADGETLSQLASVWSGRFDISAIREGLHTWRVPMIQTTDCFIPDGRQPGRRHRSLLSTAG